MGVGLIARSASLCIASMSCGVGFPGGPGCLTIYMKRIGRLLLRRAAGALALRNCLANQVDEPACGGSTWVLKKIASSRLDQSSPAQPSPLTESRFYRLTRPALSDKPCAVIACF